MGSWRGLFNIHTLNTIHWYSHATFVCVFYLCGIAIQHSCFIVIHNSTPIFQNPIFNFFNSTLRIDNSTSIFISNTIHMRHFVCVFYLNLCSIECLVCVLCCRVRYACSAMQHSCLDIELSLSAQLRAFCGLWLVYDDLTDVITLY